MGALLVFGLLVVVDDVVDAAVVVEELRRLVARLGRDVEMISVAAVGFWVVVVVAVDGFAVVVVVVVVDEVVVEVEVGWGGGVCAVRAALGGVRGRRDG